MMKYLLLFFLLCLLSLYFLYSFVFRHPMRKRPNPYQIPDSPLYRHHTDKMLECLKSMDASSCEQIQIRSFDGLALYAKLYVKKPDYPFILFFHGYHGVTGWDGYGFFKIYQEYDCNLLMVDVRAHGKSQGDITFGIKERYDCKQWTEYITGRFGTNVPLILAGVSMGASSIMMSSSLGLPANVKGIVADCGYSQPSQMIKETIRKMNLPAAPIYPFIALGARIFGRFSLTEASPLNSMEHSHVPILFIHGNKDSIVPPYMCDLLYENCISKKYRLIVDSADHANSALVNFELYQKEIMDFINTCCSA